MRLGCRGSDLVTDWPRLFGAAGFGGWVMIGLGPRHARSVRILLLAASVCSVSAARADDLVDLIPGLYGGDGIILANPNHAAHFGASTLQSFRTLTNGLSSGINVTTVGSSTASFTFDVQQAVFVRSTDSLGPVLAERAETIGEHKFNIAYTFTHEDFTRLGGERLNSFNLAFKHEDLCSGTGDTPPCPPGGGVVPSPGDPAFELDQILVNMDIHLSQDTHRYFGKFGITSAWDVGLIVPVVQTELRVTSLAKIQRNSGASSAGFHSFCLPGQVGCAPNADISTLNDPDRTTSGNTNSKTALGDITLYTKYNFLRSDTAAPDLAFLGGVRLDTGDVNNFSGAGNTGFDGYFIASKTLGMFSPHLNLGVELTTDGNTTNIWRVIAGSEFTPIRWFTLSADVLGQQSFSGGAVNGKLWDVGVGVKVNPISTFALIGDVVFPINPNDGLRSQFRWTAGLEFTF